MLNEAIVLSDGDWAGELCRLTQFIDAHPRLFVLTGAGCSTASGIPAYRDADGAWRRSPPIQFRDFTASAAARQRYWAGSLLGWEPFSRARPNRAHLALVQLEKLGHVRQLVTQNVDGLHQRAGHRQVIDLHGRLDRIICLSCRAGVDRDPLQAQLRRLNPQWARRAAGAAHLGPDGHATLARDHAPEFKVPACPRCGGILKPDVVFFGEPVPRARVQMARQALFGVDAVLVVGSSLTVYSGYRFCRQAFERDLPVAAVNLGRTRADAQLTLKVEGPCEAVLDAAAQALAPAGSAA
jgi:NAD-dependent SIR2 family protein deacetylase